MSRGLGKTQQKILLIMLGGVALGLSRSPKYSFRILDALRKDWKSIDNKGGKRAIRSLYEQKLLKEQKQKNGSIKLVLSEKGRSEADRLTIENLVIPKRKKIIWDRKWRVVAFDIPENHKKSRDALRFHLKRLGFVELQKSLFVYPFECFDQVQEILDFYFINKYVRLIVADAISQDKKLKTYFRVQ